MNQVTRDIAKILNCDLESALKVQQYMMGSDIRFSEISERTFIREVKRWAWVVLV